MLPFLVTPCLVVAVQPCMERIPIKKKKKISASSSGKTDKYDDLTGEEVLPSNKQQIIEQTQFTYTPLGKAFEKQTKTTEDQGEKI